MNSKKINILILSLLISFISLAQSPKRIITTNLFKGMEAITSADIDNELSKAKEDFDKVLLKEPESAMANLGLAIVYSYDKYSNKDFCKALGYFNKAYEAQSQFTDRDKVILNDLVLKLDNKRRKRSFIDNMDWLNQQIEDKLIKFIREEKKSNYAKSFLKEFPDSKYYGNVSHILNYIEFREAENKNTVAAFNQFLKDYPESAQADIAKKMRNKLAYKTAISEGSLDSYRNFVEKYPKAEHVGEIKKLMEEMAFKEAYNKHTLEAIDRFIVEFPNSSKISEAKVLKHNLLFEWAKSVNSLEAYNKFVSSCPEDNRYNDIFNLKAIVLAEQIVKEFPVENHKFTKVFDNQQLNDFGGGIAKRQNGELVVAASSRKAVGEMYDSWLLGLDASGKMIWNMFLGNRFDDIVNKVSISAQNEIYVAGITGAIVDSLKGQAWLYKLDSNGNNIFNQRIDIDEVLDFVVYPDNKVLIAGYSKNTKDSTFTPNLVKLNANGKKLWSRAYSSKGKIYNLANDASGIIYVAAGNWIFAIDQAGYLIWDILLDQAIKYTAVGINENNKLVFAGLNASGAFASAYDIGGEKIWESPISISEYGNIEQIITLPDNSFVLAGTFNNKIKVVHIDETGGIKSKKEFSLPQGIKLNDLTATDGNFVVISATRLTEKSDLIVFKIGL
jgi:outer membrane protein assembly factor BamD (BamD/ComL family)